MKEIKQCTAEVIGTFFLCFAGIAAILSNDKAIGSGAGIVGIALAHGLALSVAINAFGGLSGAHFNPAVTIGMLVTGRISGKLAGGYVVSQLIGATLASFLCLLIFPPEVVKAQNLGIPLPGPLFEHNIGVILLVEFILTFLLMTAIYGTAVDVRGQAVKIGAFGIGLTVTFDILAAGAVTGASMNPARSFGPALLMGKLDGVHWCYWAAPIAGAVVAALFFQHFILPEDKPSKK